MLIATRDERERIRIREAERTTSGRSIEARVRAPEEVTTTGDDESMIAEKQSRNGSRSRDNKVSSMANGEQVLIAHGGQEKNGIVSHPYPVQTRPEPISREQPPRKRQKERQFHCKVHMKAARQCFQRETHEIHHDRAGFQMSMLSERTWYRGCVMEKMEVGAD